MPRNSIKLNYKIQALLTQLGENIRTARLRRNITMEELSIGADISLPTLRNIEAGNPKYKYRSILKSINSHRPRKRYNKSSIRRSNR